MKLASLVEASKQSIKLMGVGKKFKDVPPLLSDGVLNPYYAFLMVTTKGLPKEIVEVSPGWTGWHETWYFSFELSHKRLSGGSEERRKADMEQFIRSKAGQEAVVAFKKILA